MLLHGEDSKKRPKEKEKKEPTAEAHSKPFGLRKSQAKKEEKPAKAAKVEPKAAPAETSEALAITDIGSTLSNPAVPCVCHRPRRSQRRNMFCD